MVSVRPTTRMASTSQIKGRPLIILAALSPLLVSAAQNPFIKQQFLINSQQLEPYNLPQDQSAQVLTKSPLLEATYPIQGYDIFTPGQQDGAALAVDGWRLQIKVTTDISLKDANPSEEDDAGEDDDFCSEFDEFEDLESKVFDAALISLLAPDNLSPSTNLNTTGSRIGNGTATGSWTVCAAIWVTGLILNNNSSTTSPLGTTDNTNSCTGLLSNECIAEMTAGFNSAPDGNCQNQTVPASCQALGGLDGLPAFNLPQTLTGTQNGIFPLNTPIFAASTHPLDKNDTNTLNTISNWVFPVVMSWTQNNANQQESTGNTQSHVSCVRIIKEVKGSSSPASDIGSGPVIGSGVGVGRLRSGAMAIWSSVLIGLGVLIVL